jgi:pimeloyl-ACP methyl ester carboxylesterase
MRRAALSAVAVLGLFAGAAACSNPTNPNPPTAADTPVVFVHGLLGSGEQYRSQALRWASNGVPAERVQAFNYNTAVTDASGLNAFVDAVRRQFGVDRINLVGHSLGTSVVRSYVSANAAKVNRFVLVDGLGCPTGTANRSCLDIRAADLGQTHVEASTSPESFARQYRFFTGREPATTAVVAEPPAQVRIAGKALELQTNRPAAGAAGQVWEVDTATGGRVASTPAGTFTVATDGAWGPLPVTGGKHYEIEVRRAANRTAHYYFQPFARSSSLVHLIGAPSTSASETNTNKGAGHTTLVVNRQREFWRSHGARNDTLQISTGGQPAVNVFQNVTADVIGIHVHDNRQTPGVSSLALLDYFRSQAFQTGVDVYLPAANPPTGTISVANAPRGDTGRLQRLNVANWPSSTDKVSAEFNDYVQ